MAERVRRQPIEVFGVANFKQYLILSFFSQRQVIFKDIRSQETNPGLLKHELSLLQLVQKITNGCAVNLNKTGTRLIFTPGQIDSN